MIWCLFSVEHNYDQPDNNLVAWWREKPGFETLAEAMDLPFTADANILAVVKVHQGSEETVPTSQTSFRLECIGEGKLKPRS